MNLAALLLVVVAGTQDDPAARAADVLGQARAALGGPQFARLESFRMKATVRRFAKGGEATNDIEALVALPGRFRKSERVSVGDMEIASTVYVLDGGRVWASDGDPSDQRRQLLARELHRLSVLFLLKDPEASATYAGEAVAPDGAAHVLQFEGRDGDTLRLFVDKASHRPLMLTYQGRSPRATVSTIQGSTREEVERKSLEARERRAAEASVVGPTDIEVRVREYHKRAGALWPAGLSVVAGGETVEEWTIERVEPNPKIDPKDFRTER